MKPADRFIRATIRGPAWFGGAELPAGSGREPMAQMEAIIDASNVAEYLFLGSDQEQWDWHADFPCLTPPFRRFVLAYRIPSRMRNEARGVFQALPSSKDVVVFLAAGGALANGAPAGLRAELFLEQDDGAFLGPVLAEFHLDDKGALVGNPKMVAPPDAKLLAAGMTREKLWHLTCAPLFPVGLAISFMHCKNAQLVEAPVPEKLAKARARRGDRVPLLRHQVLEIEPMKRLLRTEGRADVVGLQRALHITRGHFRDYRTSGLFGQHHGVFWFDSHVRGSSQQGAVRKTYEVAAPAWPALEDINLAPAGAPTK